MLVSVCTAMNISNVTQEVSQPQYLTIISAVIVENIRRKYFTYSGL